MNLPALAIRYSSIVITVVVLLMIWGVSSFYSMPRREDPEYTVRTCAITTRWPGAPTEKVEQLITDKIEKICAAIDEVKRVRSTTTVGLSTVFVDAEDFVTPEQIDNVWDKVRARIKRVEMPEPGIEPDVNDEYGDTNIMLLAVYQQPLPGEDSIREANRYTLRQLDIFSEKVRDAVKLLPGVAKADQFGVREEAIYLQTDLGVWSQLDLTTDELKSLVEQRNIVAPGGNIDTPVGRFSVKPGGEFDAVNELNSMIVQTITRDGQKQPVYLRDMGLNVVRDYKDPPTTICRFVDAKTSQPAVIVGVTMKAGANIVDICDAIKKRVFEMQQIEQVLPPDLGMTPVSDQSQNVNTKISDVVNNVIGAVLIVIVVVFLVVGFRSAAVMAANIPIVVLASLALITLFGVQLEQISLASIIIALGLLVDNAVQVCDQSRTNQMAGMSPLEATVTGTNQLSFPMLSGTLTTIAAFFPMLIGLTGTKREYIYSLPVTLTVTLAASWVLAMTFCSLLAYHFIRPPRDPDQPSAPLPWLMQRLSRMFARKKPADAPQTDDGVIDRVFRRIAGTAIKAKFLTIGISIALLIAALSLPVSSQFFPKDARDQLAVDIWLPENVTIEQTDAAARQVEAILQKISPATDQAGQSIERVRAMRTMVGSGGARWYLGRNPESLKPNFAEILVRTTAPQYTPQLAAELKRIAIQGDTSLGLALVAAARVIPRELDLGPSVDAPIGLRLYGTGFADMSTMRKFGEQLKAILREQPETWDVHDVWGAFGFQLRVDVDEDKANLAGVTNSQVAQSLNAYFSGHQLSTFREGDHLVPVSLRLAPEHRGSLSEINSIFVEGRNGKVPLESVATTSVRWEPSRIERRELNRMLEVRARVADGVMANDVVDRVMDSEAIQQLQQALPGGMWLEVGGEKYESLESQQQMAICLQMAILLIILCLVVQFNGWAKPVIILSTVPLALIGALPGLYFSGNPLGFMPQLGILSLFGIVLNTGLIFIEFADVYVREESQQFDGSVPIHGLTREQFRRCLVEAARLRLLPIFLTTATTIGGLLPLAISGGPLGEGMA